MTSEIRDPTGGTGTGADITDIGTRKHRTARDSVVHLVDAETGTAA